MIEEADQRADNSRSLDVADLDEWVDKIEADPDKQHFTPLDPDNLKLLTKEIFPIAQKPSSPSDK